QHECRHGSDDEQNGDDEQQSPSLRRRRLGLCDRWWCRSRRWSRRALRGWGGRVAVTVAVRGRSCNVTIAGVRPGRGGEWGGGRGGGRGGRGEAGDVLGRVLWCCRGPPPRRGSHRVEPSLQGVQPPRERVAVFRARTCEELAHDPLCVPLQDLMQRLALWREA